jgi:hypothetical protein
MTEYGTDPDSNIKINSVNATSVGGSNSCRIYGASLPTGSSASVYNNRLETPTCGIVAYNLENPWTLQWYGYTNNTDGNNYNRSDHLLAATGFKNGIIIGWSAWLGTSVATNSTYCSGWAKAGERQSTWTYWEDYGESGEWVAGYFNITVGSLYTPTAGTYNVNIWNTGFTTSTFRTVRAFALT